MTRPLRPILEWSPTTTPFQTPVWVDITNRLISHKTQTSHRQSTIGRFEAGTSSFVLDNPDRALEPYYTGGTYYPNVRRRKRIRLRATDGTTIWPVVDHFIERIVPTYPDRGLDATVTLECSDLTALIAADELEHPYAREVLLDAPDGYWRLNESSGATAADRSGNGRNAVYYGSVTYGQVDPITDDVDGAIGVNTIAAGVFMDPALAIVGTGQFWIEAWIRKTDGTTDIPLDVWRQYAFTGSDVVATLEFGTNTAGNARILLVDFVGGTTPFVIGATDVTDGSWHHLVATRDSGGTLRLYVDGLSVGTPVAAGTVNIRNYGAPTSGYNPSDFTSRSFFVDELAVRSGASLASDRVGMHYFLRNALLGEDTGERISHVIAYLGIPTGMTSVADGISTMTSAGDMEGQSAIEAMRLAELTEGGWLFVDRSGLLTFLNRYAPQVVTRCSVVQANYGKAGGRTEPSEVEMEDDVMEMANVVKNIGRNTITSTIRNQTSVGNNGRISRTLSTAPEMASEVTARAQWEAALRADPSAMRINRLGFDVAVDNAAAVMGREVMDRVNVHWVPPKTGNAPGVGTALDQDTLVQGIETEGMANEFWRVTFDLSSTDTLGMFRVGVSTVGGPDRVGF
jgi:concanavalin A-like lectin/glucanase superfamily protein